MLCFLRKASSAAQNLVMMVYKEALLGYLVTIWFSRHVILVTALLLIQPASFPAQLFFLFNKVNSAHMIELHPCLRSWFMVISGMVDF